jgi:hypothetical protein
MAMVDEETYGILKIVNWKMTDRHKTMFRGFLEKAIFMHGRHINNNIGAVNMRYKKAILTWYHAVKVFSIWGNVKVILLNVCNDTEFIHEFYLIWCNSRLNNIHTPDLSRCCGVVDVIKLTIVEFTTICTYIHHLGGCNTIISDKSL